MKRIGPAFSFLSLILVGFFALCPSVTGEPVSAPATAHVPVEELRLTNGMTVLLVPRPESTTVAVGWMVEAGSADDASDQTGLGHLLEHMMFKGSRTVGTRDLATELEALAAVDQAWTEKNALLSRVNQAPPRKQRKLRARLDEASSRLATAQARASALAFLGQYSFLYSQQGGTGLNANTYRDLTLYHLTLPSEKIELWFWLESDRLLAPVFRQFYKEVQIIHEERRQRIESTPTGQLDEQLRESFWGTHPYGWNPMGRAADLDTISRRDALDHFQRHYRPDRMTAVLVGGFDLEQVTSWAQRYFGRLPTTRPRSESRSPGQTLAMRSSEQRLVATCNCPPQVRILYPSARFGDPDAYALQLLSAVLNGRSGRLHRSLVLDQQIAFSAYTQQISWRQAGEFSLRAESKGAADPTELIRAWDRQVDLLQSEAPTPEEIQRAKNRSTADVYRSLKDPTALMKQLLIYQGLGDWRYIHQWTERIQGLSSDDLVRVAARYLVPERRTVAIYRRPEEPARP